MPVNPPGLGFDPGIDKWVKDHPGIRSFTCSFCGIYEASKPMCNMCEEWDVEGRKEKEREVQALTTVFRPSIQIPTEGELT